MKQNESIQKVTPQVRRQVYVASDGVKKGRNWQPCGHCSTWLSMAVGVI